MFVNTLMLRCDNCNVEFERVRCIKQALQRAHHFCNSDCTYAYGLHRSNSGRKSISNEEVEDLQNQFKTKRLELQREMLSQRKTCETCKKLYGPRGITRTFQSSRFCSRACRNCGLSEFGTAQHGTIDSRFGLIKYGSGYEREFIKQCATTQGMTSLKRCEQTFAYVSHTGRERRYYPDFLVTFNGTDFICEIKSTYTVKHPNVALKANSVIEQGINYALLVGMQKKKNVTFDLSKLAR